MVEDAHPYVEKVRSYPYVEEYPILIENSVTIRKQLSALACLQQVKALFIIWRFY